MIAARHIAVAPLRVYRRLVSPLLAPRCRYHPSCSSYAIEAVQTFGILRGASLAIWRVLRCNPFSLGGYDPVTRHSVTEAPAPTLADSVGKTTGHS